MLSTMLTWSEFKEHWGGREYELIEETAATVILVSPAGSEWRLDAELLLLEPVAIARADLG